MTQHDVFTPTHVITLEDGEQIEVELVDGAAYTRAEWDATASADYERQDNGDWTFQGQPFAGTVQALVPDDPHTWICADDSGCRIEIEADSAQEAAQEYVDGGEWGESDETTWIHVRVWRWGVDANGDRCAVDEDTYTITLEPLEPACTDRQEHDWQAPYGIVGGCRENPGVYGHGGGVTIQEVCMRCGCGKLTDTWAQDPSNGRQGLRSVRYEPGKYRDQVEQQEAE